MSNRDTNRKKVRTKQLKFRLKGLDQSKPKPPVEPLWHRTAAFASHYGLGPEAMAEAVRKLVGQVKYRDGAMDRLDAEIRSRGIRTNVKITSWKKAINAVSQSAHAR